MPPSATSGSHQGPIPAKLGTHTADASPGDSGLLAALGDVTPAEAKQEPVEAADLGGLSRPEVIRSAAETAGMAPGVSPTHSPGEGADSASEGTPRAEGSGRGGFSGSPDLRRSGDADRSDPPTATRSEWSDWARRVFGQRGMGLAAGIAADATLAHFGVSVAGLSTPIAWMIEGALRRSGKIGHAASDQADKVSDAIYEWFT